MAIEIVDLLDLFNLKKVHEDYPLVNVVIAVEKHNLCWGNQLVLWSINSIVLLNYQNGISPRAFFYAGNLILLFLGGKPTIPNAPAGYGTSKP